MLNKICDCVNTSENSYNQVINELVDNATRLSIVWRLEFSLIFLTNLEKL